MADLAHDKLLLNVSSTEGNSQFNAENLAFLCHSTSDIASTEKAIGSKFQWHAQDDRRRQRTAGPDGMPAA